MSWLRRLVAYFSPRRPGFDPRSFHVRIVLDKVSLGHVFRPVHLPHYNPTDASYSFSSTCCSYHNGKRAKPGNLKKAMLFRKSGLFKGAHHHNLKIVGHWGYSLLHSLSGYFVELNAQLQSPAGLSLRKHRPSSLYVLDTGCATEPIPIRWKSEKFLCASSMTPLSCDYIEHAVADS